jgi:hypothetical protein
VKKNELNNQQNHEKIITLKILGSIENVKATAQKIETLFPVYIEGKIRPNDNSDGVHLFITLPAESCAGSPRQEQTQPTNETPIASFNYMERTSK